ncbi:unnamed protein product [Strongylus vulgaris]|uniref:Uncharacterized protein n=1 Tax=Strongylus vulgaris TaxID=40348 RepID=A0A3P7JH91_STRVU|nr:unnamed protein product [Strongylus vulgaris]
MKRTREDEMEDAGLPYVSGKDIVSYRNLVPLRMIRGEHREIEEEIANRILSDISEEGSISGSLASIDDLEGAFVPKREEVGQRKTTNVSHSRKTQLKSRHTCSS